MAALYPAHPPPTITISFLVSSRVPRTRPGFKGPTNETLTGHSDTKLKIHNMERIYKSRDSEGRGAKFVN
ncbi:hypothetical protein TL16_g10111 [Triparma laevis f. inornata]|uniref:Uncharacterized protein n=1 Tax=Triparma laevis f. inornata TaxID=1714386 RepID=A0A9W7B6H5_9STRA|nr:hypothetical protein TL16_g10111 [Triparma laevis f. inornata]